MDDTQTAAVTATDSYPRTCFFLILALICLTAQMIASFLFSSEIDGKPMAYVMRHPVEKTLFLFKFATIAAFPAVFLAIVDIILGFVSQQKNQHLFSWVSLFISVGLFCYLFQLVPQGCFDYTPCLNNWLDHLEWTGLRDLYFDLIYYPSR